MKSLALNLFQKILPRLLLLLLILFGVMAATGTGAKATTLEGASSTLTSTASSSSPATHSRVSLRNRSSNARTTTPAPPFLPKPPQLRRRATSTTTSSSNSALASAVSTKSPVPVPSQRQRRPQISRQHAAASSAEIMASTSSKPALISETSSGQASTRLARHVDATTPQTQNDDVSISRSNVRQHRSFQSNSNGNARHSYEDVETSKQKTPVIQKRRSYTRVDSTTTTEGTKSSAESPLPRHQRLRTTTNYNTNSKAPPSPLSSSLSASHADGRPSVGPNRSISAPTPPQTGNSNASNNNNEKLTSRHNLQTPKTPRMIQRLVAGHIQNTDSRSSATTISNSTLSERESMTTGQQTAIPLGQSYRDNNLNANIRIDSQHTSAGSSTQKDSDQDYHDDDEALLEDSGDFDNWDNGILRLSAGAGKENSPKTKKNKEDSKKTLADQVRDGKYGLIEKELFRRPPKRPGVLSYLPNKEVPEDNERNFGGLNEEDIWLAEDHLLVIKGGSLNEDNEAEPWPAIDDYNAAGRPIKIPDNPKVPPPFPVQLEENGPVQLIGNNKLTVVYPVANEPLSLYTTGPEAHHTSAESDSDDEKNLIARPGKIKGLKENHNNNNEPGYNYASPSLPWLSSNQTTGDTSTLSRPVNFPILGPFLYGRNGSLDNATEDFDEDDPSLYYPPPYSFVYKSNYTNPVPPGPLVPGIVVPPPPDHFSRLEKLEKERRPSGASIPSRYRGYGTTTTTTPPTTTTTSTTTTTTTTSTTTTTESPFRHSITKISEYTPKVINLAASPPRPVYSPTASPASRFQPLPSPSPPPPTNSGIVQPVPVPVAVPIPIYSVNVEPGTISFVPTTPQSQIESLSKSNPIYYEYFEAKRQPGGSHLIDDFLSSTEKPYPTPSPKPIKLYSTSKRPYKNRNYPQPLAPNHRYVDENVVVITPKPEVRLKQRPYYKQRPLHNFEQDVQNIRDSLRYYQNQELRDNNIPRTPKAKPVFDYNFDSSKSVTNAEGVRNTFQPPLEFDVEPFQPMVTYSPPASDEDSFKAVNVDKVDESSSSLQAQGREELEEQYDSQPKYISTTTLVPVQQPERSKKIRVGAKYLQQPQQLHVHQYQQQRQQQYSQQQYQQHQEYNRWVAVNKQEFGGYTPQETLPPRERYQEPQRNRDYSGYYYGPSRQNNRFYEEPFQTTPNRKIVNYRPQQQQPAQQQLPQHNPVWSLENDTYVNYAPNRPPLNPDAEFINPYQTIPVNTYQAQPPQRFANYQQQQTQLSVQQQLGPPPPPPALSHQSQYYTPPQRLPGRQYQTQPGPAPVSLHRDILVNYRQPLPPINPDSEYISHPQVVRNQQGVNPYYRPQNTYRQSAPAIPVPNLNIEGEADVYFLTPKFRRANNLNNNPSNRNQAPQQVQQQQQQQQQGSNGK
uniref:Uncharacterized protein n=1 Tax=Stomoxys calcitrans TaxID=35570 RepID=A0A1I8NSK6_STOCA